MKSVFLVEIREYGPNCDCGKRRPLRFSVDHSIMYVASTYEKAVEYIKKSANDKNYDNRECPWYFVIIEEILNDDGGGKETILEFFDWDGNSWGFAQPSRNADIFKKG